LNGTQVWSNEAVLEEALSDALNRKKSNEMTAIMNSSFSSNHMNQIAIEEIEALQVGQGAYP